MSTRGRATFNVGLACQNRCIFCAQDGLDNAASPDLAQLRAGADEITFVGGEPTLADQLARTARQARALGFVAIGLQTNARDLGDPTAVDALADAGVTDLHLSIHGPTAAAHDYHTGADGSFAAIGAAAQAARNRGMTVVATTVITRSNFRVLVDMAPRLLDWSIAAWTLSVPLTAGRAADGFDRVHARLGLALPYALHALRTAEAAGLPTEIEGAPLCTLGPFAASARPSEPRTHPDVCDGCGARPQCPGIDGAYARRFTAQELHPRNRVEATTTMPAHLRRMFVGTGPNAVRDPLAHEPPAAARRRLPLVGRPAPAAQEVRPGTPKQTGEALRELFPDLFED